MKKLFYYLTVSKLLNYITNKLLFYKLSIENVCYIFHDKILIVITMYFSPSTISQKCIKLCMKNGVTINALARKGTCTRRELVACQYCTCIYMYIILYNY